MLNPENKKYLHISQHWTSRRNNRPNPVLDEGKKSLTNLSDLEKLVEYHSWSDNRVYFEFNDSSGANWGQEVYQVLNNQDLKLIGSDYDSSD